MNIVLKVAALSCATVLAMPSLAAIGQPTPLQITDVVLSHSFQIQGENIAIAPDSGSLVTTLCDSRKIKVEDKDNGRMAVVDAAYRSMGCDLWRYDLGGGAGRQLTTNEGNNWSPSWSPDGSKLAYISDRSGHPQLWVRDQATGAKRQVGDARLRQWIGLEVPLWLADGASVVVKLRPKGAEDADDQSSTMLVGARSEKTFPGSSVVLFKSPTPPPAPIDASATATKTDAALVDLAVIDIRTGAVRTLLENARIVTHRQSPSRKSLLLMERSMRAPNNFNVYEVWILDVASGKKQLVDPEVFQGFPGAVSFSPDESKVAYFSTDEEAWKASRLEKSSSSVKQMGGDLYIWDRRTGKSEKAEGIPTNGLNNDFLPPLWSSDGRRLYLAGNDKRVWAYDTSTRAASMIEGDYADVSMVLAKSGKNVAASGVAEDSIYIAYSKPEESLNGLAQLDVATGKVLTVRESDQVYGSIFDAPVMSPDGRRIVFQAQSASQADDLWVSDATLKNGRRISAINTQLEKYEFGKSQRFAFRSLDGKELHAGMLLPPNYQKGKRYPLVLWVYASNEDTSKSVNRFGLVGMDAFNMQMLATRGYVVAFPEIPTNRGTPVKDLINAVNPAIDRLVELGIADPDRLAVMGNSNGGYSTLALITQTNRFKAAVMNSGFGDLGAFYGTMGGGWIPWLEANGGSMGAAPWQAPDQYIANAPFYHLDKVHTPLIIQAGASDHGIIQHSDQVWVGLNKLQKEVTYLRYGGESHVLAGAANLQDYWQRVLRFLDEKLAVPPVVVNNRRN